MTEMRARHKKGEGILGIQQLCDNEWSVPSSSQTDMSYNVLSYNVLSATCTCKLICNFCFVCEHMYTCTCTDYLIKSLSCKHIHAMHMVRNNIENVEENDCPDYTHSLEVLKSLVPQEKLQTSSTDSERLKELGLNRPNDIIALFSTSNNIDVLRALVDGMQNAHTIACGL